MDGVLKRKEEMIDKRTKNIIFSKDVVKDSEIEMLKYDDDLPEPVREDGIEPDPTWDDNITDPWSDYTWDEKPDNDIPSKKIGSMNH